MIPEQSDNPMPIEADFFSSTQASPAFLELIWKEFFQTRGRGISIQAHFPWINNECEDAIFIEGRAGGEIVCGLAMVDRSSCMVHGAPRTAALGLVVVRPDFRGRGLSGQLLEAGKVTAAARGYQALTLWTSKHDVYSKHGFFCDDCGLFGSVWLADDRIRPASIFESGIKILRTGGPLSCRGIPPFARDAGFAQIDGGIIVFLRDSESDIFSHAHGPLLPIASFLNEHMPPRWKMNIGLADPLIGLLKNFGWQMNLSSSHLQMWCRLGGHSVCEDVARLGHFSILDRI